MAQIRNIRDYESKSKEDLIKALCQRKPKSKTKPQTPKPEPEPKAKPEIRVNKGKLKKLRKDFDELRYKFSKKEIKEYRKAFYNVKNCKNLSISEIKEAGKNLTRLKKSLRFKKFHGNIDSVDYEEVDNYGYNYDFGDDVNIKKLEALEHYLKSLTEIIANQ